MPLRIAYGLVAPDARKAMIGLESYVKECGLEHTLLELVKTRASQINGCAYCVDMHTQDARAAGESEQRLYTLSVWRETPFFSDRERAALAWTEAVTTVANGHPSDEAFQALRQHFTDKEIVDLTMAIVTINGWNRLSIAMGTEAGTYRPARR